MKIFETLDLTDPPPGTVLGNHGIWIPPSPRFPTSCGRGIKVPFQWGGRVTKRTRHEPGYPRETIADEVAILCALAYEGMAPSVGELVFFRDLMSDYPGAWHCDPCGAYGYEIADASRLPTGRFSVEAMRRFPIAGSPGAWGDVATKADNLVNGYLVDVRRSAWDLLRWDGERFELPVAAEDPAELAADVHRLCQFPAGERAEAYQDFYLDGSWRRGQRRVMERATLLGFAPTAGETVLEIGCQSGGFVQLAALAGAEAIGVELELAYVDCARRLARHAGMNICIRQLDAVAQRDELLAWIRARWPGGVDHLLLLSMEKHLGHAALFGLVDAVAARRTYVETNAVAVDDGIGPPPAGAMKLWPEIARRGGRHVGDSRDRNLRRLYVIEKGVAP